jgi:hypothetical protein
MTREELAIGANLDPRAVAFYRDVIGRLRAASVPFLVGGAWALERYTGIAARTKDLDLFFRQADLANALQVLTDAGYRTELTSPVWLAKAFMGEHLVDLIFNAGNEGAPVDDSWFVHAPRSTVLGYRLRLVPPEEMIWQKAFLMERDRFDGADVLHLIRAAQGRLDWKRLKDRFGIHWRVLLAHLVLFDYVYPSDRACVPDSLRRELLERARAEVGRQAPEAREDLRLCYGTFLSRYQYTDDIERLGYTDARKA